MSALLRSIEERVGSLVAEAWPGYQWPVRFVPLLDLSLGEIGSDILQVMAKDLRELPNVLAERILPNLQRLDLGEFSVIEGFLNLRLLDTELQKQWKDPKETQPAKRNIIVVPRRKGLELLGYARVVASASVQWFLSRSSGSHLASITGNLAADAAWPEFRRWFEVTLEKEPEAGTVSDQTLNTVVKLADPKNFSVLWVYHDFLERKRFRRFVAQLLEHSGGEGIVPALDRDSVVRLGDTLDIATVKSLTDLNLAALILYLSRSIPGRDLDLSAPRHQERTNLRWSLGALHERLLRWQALGDSTACKTFSPAERIVVSRVRALPVFRQLAATTAQVADFLAALESMIEAASKHLNAPSVRLNLDRQSVTPQLAQIIAGAMQESSDNINSCLLFQGLEPAPPSTQP